jgi:hypothetical protein
MKVNLDNLRVAKPCPVSWSEMEGDDRTRYCALCKHNVHNISEMSRAEAEEFLRSVRGRTCVRMYRREDGKVMTRDCPKGMAVARRKLSTALVMVFTSMAWTAAAATLRPIPKGALDSVKKDVQQSPWVKAILDKINPPASAPAPPTSGHVTMGVIACPPPVTSSKTPGP